MKEEIEYYSNCCEAPPYSEDVVDANNLLGQCMKCGMGSTFKRFIIIFKEKEWN